MNLLVNLNLCVIKISLFMLYKFMLNNNFKYFVSLVY